MMRVLTAFSALALLTGVGLAEVWNTYHGSYALTGVSQASFKEKPTRLWRTRVGEDLPSPVVGGHGRLFCIADDTAIVALTAGGKELWRKTFKGAKLSTEGKPRDEKFTAPPLYVDEELLVVAANSGTVFALAPDTGKQIWKTAIDGNVRGAPNYSAGTKDDPGKVFVVSKEDGVVFALSDADGSQLWKSEELDRTDGHPAVDDHYVALGNCTAAFITLFVSDGKTAGSIAVGEESEMAGGVALHDGQVFAGNRSGSVAAADIEKGSILWRHEKEQGELFTTPAVTDKLVVFYGADGALYCVKRKSGKEVWAGQLEGFAPVSPVVADSTVLAAIDGSVFGLELKDGKKIWSIEIGDEITEPAIVDGALVVGVDDGYVAAYGKDGK